MAEEYELKQVKVRLKLSETEPLYSMEQITTPDKAAEVMADALAQMDRNTYSHSEVQGSIRQSDIPVRMDFDELMEKTEEVGLSEIEEVKSDQKTVSDFRSKIEDLFVTGQFDGMSPATIEDAVYDQVQTVIDDYGLDARIEDVIVSGSRCRGLEKEASDLDVVVDINPINTGQTGTLAEYLPNVEKYLTEKAAEIEKDKAAIIAEPEKPKQESDDS